MTGDDPIMCPHCGCVPPRFEDAGLIALGAELKDACETMIRCQEGIFVTYPSNESVNGFADAWQAMVDALERHKKGAT